MKIVEPSYNIIYPQRKDVTEMFDNMERIARVCYKSEDKIGPGTASKLITKLRDSGHETMLEFGDMAVHFVCSRGVSHEMVRHRLCSFAQESTRYCRYKDGIQVIKPIEFEEGTPAYIAWESTVNHSEHTYLEMLDSSIAPQVAREVLPTCLKTEIVVKANIREWRNIFKLRVSRTTHPHMRQLMFPLLDEARHLIPVVFDDIWENLFE